MPGRRELAARAQPEERAPNEPTWIRVPRDTTTLVPEQRIPAWRTSLVGLPPEQGRTYGLGPIMLTHHAAWLLRLAHHANDPLLRDAAENAVLGRYANFPGYYFKSFETNVYQRVDYPLHPYQDLKYNAIFYNHVWPHIALLVDYLVSDAFDRSGGRVDFPSAYAPGYAYLTSKVYGHRLGRINEEKDVALWLPRRAARFSTSGREPPLWRRLVRLASGPDEHVAGGPGRHREARSRHRALECRRRDTTWR